MKSNEPKQDGQNLLRSPMGDYLSFNNNYIIQEL